MSTIIHALADPEDDDARRECLADLTEVLDLKRQGAAQAFIDRHGEGLRAMLIAVREHQIPLDDEED